MSVSSRVSSELPDILPADSADVRRPYTVVPLGATTRLSTWRLVSRLAVKRYPAFCLVESIESIMRIKIRVPAGMLILFVPWAADDASSARTGFKPADEPFAKETPCAD